MKKLKVG